MVNKKAKTASTNSMIMMIVVAVLVGWIVGFAVGNTVAEDKKTTKTTMKESYDGEPSVSVTATKDAMSGFNVNIVTKNFAFAPESASQENAQNQGHAHIYVNGEKIGRVYSNWYHLPDLDEGEYEIKVSLNNNNHTPILVNGEEVFATTTVTSDGKSSGHSHSADEAKPHSHDDEDGHSHD